MSNVVSVPAKNIVKNLEKNTSCSRPAPDLTPTILSNRLESLLLAPPLFFFEAGPVFLVGLGGFVAEFADVVILQFLLYFIQILLEFIGSGLLFDYFFNYHLPVYPVHRFAPLVILLLVLLFQLFDFFLDFDVFLEGLFEGYLI